MTNMEALAARCEAAPCPKCDDSGFEETVHGGFWTGEGVWTSQSICDCPCGDDVRRERAHANQEPPE